MMKGQERRNERPVDERQGAEVFVDRIPFAAREELEAEGVPGKAGPLHKFVNDEHQNA